METGDFKILTSPFSLKKLMGNLNEIFLPMAIQKQLFFDIQSENIPNLIE
jgi:hypothetical protein